MARGITETDVHTAADELVAKGERPTVERIRAHLGTGSPNTVTRWLETWWNRLGTRLQPARPDLEDAPAVLVELAGQWWELALKHAQETARRELASSERALASERDALEASSRLVAEELAQMTLQSPGRELQRPKLQSYSTWSTSFSYRSLNLQSSATSSVEEPTEPRQRNSNSTSGFTRH